MDNMPNMVQAPEEEPKAAEKPKQRLIAAAYEYLALFVYAASVVILLFTFLTRLTTVVGPSMENTLLAGQQLVVSDIAYDPEPGDIIVFHELGNYNEPIVKRVIATEGQVVDIDFSSWTLTVDGVVIDEPYRKVDDGALLTSTQNFPITVPEGKLFAENGWQETCRAWKRDYPVVLAAVMWIAVFIIVTNLIVDILYQVLDPRIDGE